MSSTIDLTQGSWRLHTRIGAVTDPGYMGQPEASGPNTDVLFTFNPETAEVAPIVPGGLEGTWYKAVYAPSADPLDTEEKRGTHWARILPAAIEDRVFVQVVQMNYELSGAQNTLRIYVGRLYERTPVQFFGHGAGNDGYENLSFTLTQE